MDSKIARSLAKWEVIDQEKGSKMGPLMRRYRLSHCEDAAVQGGCGTQVQLSPVAPQTATKFSIFPKTSCHNDPKFLKTCFKVLETWSPDEISDQLPETPTNFPKKVLPPVTNFPKIVTDFPKIVTNFPKIVINFPKTVSTSYCYEVFEHNFRIYGSPPPPPTSALQ